MHFSLNVTHPPTCYNTLHPLRLFYFTANYFFYVENLAAYFPDMIASSVSNPLGVGYRGRHYCSCAKANIILLHPSSPLLPPTQRVLIFLYRYHRLISFMMYIAVFILFVLTLKKDYYKVQFSLVSYHV